MNISKNAITEIEQIYFDIMNGPETPLREQLNKFSAECEQAAFSKLDDNELVTELIGITSDLKINGFVMGFLYARALLG